MDVIIIRSSSIIHDPRVGKIARSLKNRYSITVLGWNREGISAELINSYTIPLNLFSLKAPTGKPSIVAYLPLFWIWIFFKLVMLRPEIVHACDLETVPPSYIYKILFGKKLVFDVFDRYAMTHIAYSSKLVYSLINSLEEYLAKRSDVLITVSHPLLKTFQKKPKHCSIILNCPQNHNVERRKPNKQPFTLVYTGLIVRNRGIERIIEAIKDQNEVELAVAGRVIDEEFFNQISKLHNVKYKGELLPVDALKLEAISDVMVILYDLAIPINNFSMPNKFFEAMMFGIPLITNVAHELIDEIRCGIKVDYNDLKQIKTAIIRLRDDNELRKMLGANGRRAFEQKYNWNVMEQELYRIYDSLLNK